MSKIDDKLKLLESDCIEIAENEAMILKKEIDEISDKEVKDKIKDLQDKLSKRYIKEENLIKQEFNKKIFEAENKSKKEIFEFKDELLNITEKEIEKKFIKFSEETDYKKYLINSIQSTLKKFTCIENIVVYLTEKDYNTYSEELKKEYNFCIEKIGNEHLGGCIIHDIVNNIIIDNTIKINIKEKIKELKKTF